MASALFESYASTRHSRDEWRAEHPGVAAIYDHMESVLAGYSPPELERLARRAEELMREQGITFNLYDDSKSTERILPFDLFPLPIAAEEWDVIERGLAQRVRAWNALLGDVYGSQEILKAGVIPFDIIYNDPQFHRECVGIKPVRDIYIHVAAVDLFRDNSGRWLVFEDHLSNPTGASYALQNRRALSQICPEMMEGQPITPIYNYPTQLLESLQSATPTGRSSARVVLLSPGIYNEAYYDHSALARQMGIPLVQGGDLIVLDNHVYLKTIAGLERVEVIYRRLDSDFIDPVAFRADSRLGVPGLLSCVRKGTVTIANALGAGIADNRALAAYMPGIIEFYLNESPLLPSVQTLSCRDVDVREQIYEHWDRYVIKSATSRSNATVWVGKDLDEAGRDALQKKIQANIGDFVAQPVVNFSTAPTWINSKLQPRHVGIRAFVLQGEKLIVSPCVLTRVGRAEGSIIISSSAGGGSKDTWILRSPRRVQPEPEFVIRHEPGRMPLGSRTADSLYWIGRYAERAEATTRILRVIQQLRLEGDVLQDPKSWHPLWEALAGATGHPTSFFKKATIQKAVNLAQYILLEEENFASSVSCLRACRQNAQQIREALPPEVWTVLNRLYLSLAVEAKQKNSRSVLDKLQSLTLQDELLTQLDELAGSVEKHMLHNDAWHFWQIGRYLERALFTATTLRQVFLKRQDERLAGGQIDADTNLDALLRMVAGQYAYRSSYRARPIASQVAHLLLQDNEFPRSIVFCLESIQVSLRKTFGEKVRTDTPLHYLNHLISELMFADISPYFVPVGPTDAATARPAAQQGTRQRAKAFADWLGVIIGRLSRLGTLVSDHYLNHQAATPLRSTLPSS